MLIERYARSMSSTWADAPEIVVVATEADLPEAIRERAQSFDAAGGVDGVYMGAKDDRVFLVAGRLKGRDDVARVVLHEVMGHAGLRRILDRATFNSVMDQIADSLPKDIEAKAREYGLNLKDISERREAADEVLAEWASRPEAPPRAITRAMVALRGWLRKHFPALKWTEADVRDLLAKARTRIEKGAEGARGESAPRFSRSQETTEAFKAWFGDSKVVDEDGRPRVVYHGSARPDRIGSVFRKSRATSGPMAFFTSDPEIASKYATGKRDTSLEAPSDYAGWFKVKVGRSTVDVDRAWWRLSPEKRAEVAEKLPHVVWDNEDGQDRIRLGGPDEYGLAGKDHWAYTMRREARGNPLRAAVEIWLNSGGLFDQEERFVDVLRAAGLPGVEFDSPDVQRSGVLPVYLAIRRPLNTGAIPSDVVTALEKASRRQGTPARDGADQWDKRVQDPRVWMERLREGLKDGSTHAWTSIPDWVTKTLRGFGYDGIQDTGGKNGGSAHDVWIPFEETQIKSATGNRGTFDSTKKDIRFARTAAPSLEDRVLERLREQRRKVEARAAAAAEAAERVRETLADPGDVMEARTDQSLEAHSKEIQSHIRPAGDRGKTRELLNRGEALYQQLTRRHYSIEKASSRLGTDQGPAHLDPGVVAELAAGHSARSEQFLVGDGGFLPGKDGEIEWTGNRALMPVLADLGPGRLNELRRYLVARRAIELHHRKPNQQQLLDGGESPVYSGIGEAVAQREVAGAPADIRKAAEEITALLDDALRYWADSGGLSAQAVKVIRDMNRAYVPFYRVLEGGDTGKTGKLVMPAKKGAALQSEQSVKRILGSGRDILDPLVSVADHIQRMIRAADLNRVGKTLVEAAALNPAGALGIVEEVEASRPTDGVTNEGKALQDAARDFGVDVDAEAASALSMLSDRKLSYADDRIKVWQDGKLREYRVAKEIGESLRAMGPDDVSLSKKLFLAPAQLLRGGVTKNPVFQVFNFIRDTGDAAVQSRNGFVPILDSIRGFKESMRDGSLRREWLAAGGGYSSLSGGGLKGAEKTIRDIAPRTVGQSVVKTLVHPLDALSHFGRPFEEAARLGEYRKARRAGKSATDAALDAARVTTNFTVHGSDAFWWTIMRAAAFANPSLQGADRAFRTFLETPRGQEPSAGRIGRAAAAVAFKGVLNVGLLSAVLYAINYDDKEIEELRKAKGGSLWWHLRVPGTKTIVRIPKPFLWGQLFGTGVESTLDSLRGAHKEAMTVWRDEVLEMLAGNVFPIPTPVKVTGELWANKNSFFGRPIVPRGLENAEPEVQASPRTGETARKIAHLARGMPDSLGPIPNVLAPLKSPAKVEHLVGSLGGSLSREVLRGSDAALRAPGASPPSKDLSELPLVGRLFANPGGTQGYTMGRFWKELDKIRSAKTTLREKMKTDREGGRLYSQEHRRALAAASTYEAAADRLGDLRQAIEALRKIPDSRMSPDAKAKRRDALEARMNQLAERVVSRNLLEEKRP